MRRDDEASNPDDTREQPRAGRGRSRPYEDSRVTAPPPARLGAYDVGRQLGRGGMGVVYEALDRRLGRQVAIKALPPSVVVDVAARERLEREAKSLAAVNHPNVATIYGLEEHEGHHYLVLELVEGVTLAERLRDGALTLADALSACAQVAAGLAGAHESGVVHRDLKPGNVMLTRRGVAKVLDFGLARRRAHAAPIDALERDDAAGADGSTIFGTPGFMSPEQVRGGTIDERTDAWAFGCLLYECLTGRAAVPGETTEARIAATLVHEPDLDALPDGTPDALRELLRRCLARDPSGRLSDLAEAQRVLDDVLAEVAPASRRLSGARRTRLVGNLPATLTSFVGREAQVAEVERLVGANALVTLTGSGGCGKTRLALHVASLLQPGLPDGAWLVELASLSDPAAVARQAAATFGLRDDRELAPQQALVAWLEPKELLLVLDNCEHVLTASAGLISAILAACPGVRVLATSREGLGVPGEHAFTVPSLALPGHGETDLDALARNEAIRLFLDRAGLVAPRLELTATTAPLVRAACERLDGIPLAIELAAARLKHLTVEQLVQRLDDRFRLLTGGSRAALPRQQTLRATIDWSHDQLPAEEQVVFRRLAVFRGGFTLEAAEAVAQGDAVTAADVLDLLCRLLDKSLVLLDDGAAPPRYRFLETVRQYAGEKLMASGEAAAARTRHRDAILALLRSRPSEGGAAEAEWLRRVASDHDNLAEAIDWSLDEPDGAEAALRLVGEAWRYWLPCGHWSEARSRCDAVLARAADAPGALRVEVLAGAGALAVRLGDLARATAFSEEDLKLRREAGDLRGMAFAHRNLGRIAFDECRPAAAAEHLSESLALSRRLGDRVGMARTLRLLALVAGLEGDRAREGELCMESLELSREIGDRAGMASSHNNLGLYRRDAGDLDAAREHLEQCLALGQEVSSKDLVATALNNLGLLACDQGRLEEARSLLCRGIGLRRELGDSRFMGSSFLGAAVLALASGDAERAARLLGAVEALHRSLGTANDLGLDWDRSVAAARTALGEPRFEAAFAAGSTLPLDRAIEVALAARGVLESSDQGERA